MLGLDQDLGEREGGRGESNTRHVCRRGGVPSSRLISVHFGYSLWILTLILTLDTHFGYSLWILTLILTLDTHFGYSHMYSPG